MRVRYDFGSFYTDLYLAPRDHQSDWDRLRTYRSIRHVRFASAAGLDRSLSLDDRADKRNRIPISGDDAHAGWHLRHHLTRGAAGGTDRALCLPSPWRLAMDLRRRRCHRALSQHLRPYRAVIPENSVSAPAGADGIGAAVP